MGWINYQFETLEETLKSFRSLSGGSVAHDESDPFTDSDYMDISGNLQEELDISKEQVHYKVPSFTHINLVAEQ